MSVEHHKKMNKGELVADSFQCLSLDCQSQSNILLYVRTPVANFWTCHQCEPKHWLKSSHKEDIYILDNGIEARQATENEIASYLETVN